MDTANDTYPALEFPASELSAFAVTIDFFIISVKNGDIIHFQPENVEHFHDWLVNHGVRDINRVESIIEDTPRTSKPFARWKGLFNCKKQYGKS